MKKQNIATAAASVQKTQITRAATMCQDTMKLAMVKPSTSTFAEAAELGQAATERAMALQASWAQDWANWLTYANTISGADTLPKLSERSGNIALQAQAQMAKQMTDMAELMENTMVSYSFWVSQQLNKED